MFYRSRFISMTLHEPPKEQVLAFRRDGEAIDRQAEVILLDPSQLGAFEALVSLSQGKLLSWEYVQGVQPAVTFEEILEVEDLVKQDPQFQAVLARRGITDMRLVMVEPWPAGYYGAEDDPAGRRLSRPIVFVRDSPHDNGHAHPVVLRSGVPTKLIDVAVANNLERAFVGAAVGITAGYVILARNVGRRGGRGGVARRIVRAVRVR